MLFATPAVTIAKPVQQQMLAHSVFQAYIISRVVLVCFVPAYPDVRHALLQEFVRTVLTKLISSILAMYAPFAQFLYQTAEPVVVALLV